jgi:hypothetical protein
MQKPKVQILEVKKAKNGEVQEIKFGRAGGMFWWIKKRVVGRHIYNK